RVRIIGAGLAGTEAAWQCARRGIGVDLWEMRPSRTTPAHQTADFAELVCSNSLKSDSENTAPWLLKQEMRRAGSLLMEIARRTAVPAGHALAVDRSAFARAVTETITAEPLITVRREEATRIDEAQEITIIASGPLTSDALAEEIGRLSAPSDAEAAPLGDPAVANPSASTIVSRLYFYDSISPIVEADSIDMEKVYRAARYDKGSADYINCPMTEQEYNRFLDALLQAQSVEGHEWEKLNYFEGCLPIEEIARRGRDTLRFGPMKPVGLLDPRTGRRPFAVVQLRQENLRADSYNLVGFQNHLQFGEQARVLRLIPGLEDARFLRFGQIHRNTYINAPTLLRPTLQMKRHPPVLFAGQISGVEGYVESIAAGQLAGIAAAALARAEEPTAVPRATAMGSLLHYICNADAKHVQPANITFDLLEPLDESTRRRVRDKKIRHKLVCDRALAALDTWLSALEPAAK
ncbi:MAG TPA: methylenetetrahydrofolate--tRNA-(uracil(54)-C(5))-methyltransferase (FADH(2)-oxidizing) TrmFO, partial [Terracidiphilus sp.]|nr:methylenetetrahydrofolate--tRNA-(uracil(54)-C(5))-methyltransferase (FADH(2)-oxidizing) TrmFO [Terracidiphilus sp.]